MSTLYQEEIARCCRQLRLSSILAEYAVTTEGETHEEYLYNVLSKTTTLLAGASIISTCTA